MENTDIYLKHINNELHDMNCGLKNITEQLEELNKILLAQNQAKLDEFEQK